MRVYLAARAYTGSLDSPGGWPGDTGGARIIAGVLHGASGR
jgi:hypothetical protein